MGECRRVGDVVHRDELHGRAPVDGRAHHSRPILPNPLMPMRRAMIRDLL